MKRKRLIISAAVITVLLFAGCGSKSASTTAAKTSSKAKISSEQVSKDIEGKEIYLKGDFTFGGTTYKFVNGQYKAKIKGTHTDSKDSKILEVIVNVAVDGTEDENESESNFKENITFTTDLKLNYKFYDGMGWKLEKLDKADTKDVTYTTKKILPELKVTDEELKEAIFNDYHPLSQDKNGDGDEDYLKITSETLKSLKVVEIKDIPNDDTDKEVVVKVEFSGKNNQYPTDERIWSGQGNLLVQYRLLGLGSNAEWKLGFPGVIVDKNNFNYSVN